MAAADTPAYDRVASEAFEKPVPTRESSNSEAKLRGSPYPHTGGAM